MGVDVVTAAEVVVVSDDHFSSRGELLLTMKATSLKTLNHKFIYNHRIRNNLTIFRV